MLERCAPLPARATRRFRVARGQARLALDVFEGEEPVARDNHLVHAFEFVIGRGEAAPGVDGGGGGDGGGDGGDDDDEMREVEVSVEMTVEGMIKVTVDAGDAADAGAGAPPSALLYFWIAALFALYVGAKLAFSDLADDLASQSSAPSAPAVS